MNAVRHRPWVACTALAYMLTVHGCTAYEPESLERLHGGPRGGLTDARVPHAGSMAPVPDGAVRDARVSVEAGPRPDAAPPDAAPPDAAFDAASDAAADAGADGSADIDAGCGDTAGAHDCCPDDQNKAAPGACGCGIADTDGDSDGTADCLDGCPADPMKTAAGICGCNRADSDQGAVVSCAGLRDALVHRYRFDGSGTTVSDARGDQDGVVINASLDGNGQLALAGGSSNEYVDLPNGLVSALTNATFEVWLTWNGGSAWQRIFDFGDNNAAEGAQGTGTSYLFLTPQMPSASPVMRVAYTANGSANETRLSASAALPSSGMHHVAVVIDDANNQMHLYQDGASVGSVAFTGSLSSIADVNNWLGRSQYSTDPELDGSLHELRIYGAALSAAQIAFSFADGPDPAYLEP